MARRRRSRKRGRRKKQAVPLLVTAAGLYPAYAGAVYAKDNPMGIPRAIWGEYTGYNIEEKKMYWEYPIRNLTLVAVGVVGHKVANKVGINRVIRKVTGGWAVL